MLSGTPFRSAFLRAPLLRAVTPFIIGLLAGRAWAVPLPWAVAMVLVAAGAWSFVAQRRVGHAHRWVAGALLWPACCAFGLLWQRLHTPAERADDLTHRQADLDGGCFRVAEVVSANERTMRVWADAEGLHAPDGIRPASGRVWLTLGTDSAQGAVHPGDRLLVEAPIDTIDRVPAPGGFDLRAWAASNKAWHQATAWNGHWRVMERSSGWALLFEDWRLAISAWLKGSALSDRERGLVKAILIGVRDELDDDQKDAFARSGTMHVLAVSGSHVGLIYAAFVFGLAFLGKRRTGRVLRGTIAIVMLWTYAGLTGFTPSVLRATITFTFFSLAEMTPWRTEPLNSLFGAAGVLLLWNPDMLVQLSFQLSFLAVLGIALFYRPILDLWAPPGRVARYAWSLFAVSMAAQLATTPLSLLTFKAFPVWFLPANMVIVGLVSVGVYGGAALLLFHAVPVLGAFTTAFMEGLLLVLDRSSVFFAHLPGAYPAVRIGGWQCLGIYVLIACASAWVLQGWRWARWATGALLVVVLVQWGAAAHQRNEQRLLVVHDDRNTVACSAVEGRDRIIQVDTLTDKLVAALEREARTLGVEHTRVLPLVRPEGTGVPVFSGAAARVALLGHMPRTMDARALDAAFGNGDTTVLVLHPALAPRQRAAVRAWAEGTGRPVFDQRRSGAYVR
ncbi:MAG: ComEC/Rec2 family competence protein [Flavobacteriales bacterium]